MGPLEGQVDNTSLSPRRRTQNTSCFRDEADAEVETKGEVTREDNAFTSHCAAFDLSGTGVIWPLDTFKICRAWHWSFLTSLFFAGAIHFVQSYGTVPGITPDPFFRIWKKNLARNLHGSSTATFQKSGSLQTSHLHDFFERNDAEKKGGLTIWQLWTGLKRQGLPLDLFGQVSNFFEWLFAFLLVWPAGGILREEDAWAVCTGEMFRRRAERDGLKHSRPLPKDSPLLIKQILSLVIVDLIVVPAIVAGMCYFVLRAVDDGVGVWKYFWRTSKQREAKAKMPEKSWRAYSDPDTDLEGAGGHPSAAGLVGLVIVVGFMKMSLLR